jgi:hypothetical protein
LSARRKVVFGVTQPVAQQPREATDILAARPDGGTGHRHVVLIRQLDSTTWLADSDGDLVVAQAAAATSLDPASPSRSTALAALPSLTALRASQLVGVIDVADQEDGSAWLLSEHIDGVSLRRLLTIATLTPIQAAYIAVRVLDGLTRLHSAGVGHGRLNAANVLLGSDGEPRLTNWALTSLARTRQVDEVCAADLESARSLVGELARNANRPVIWKHGPDEAVLTCLEHCGNSGSTAGIPAMTEELRRALQTAVCDDTGMVATRGELAALVTTLSQRVAPSGQRMDGNVKISPSAETDGPRTSWRQPIRVPAALPARPLSRANWHQPHHRWWPGLLATLVALVVLAAAGYVLARKPIGSLADRVLHRDTAASKTPGQASTHPTSTPTAKSSLGAVGSSRSGTPRPVASLAPLTAGPISGVDLRPLATCTAKSSCPLRMTVRFAPAYSGQQVAWRIAVFNRCTGSTSVLARGQVAGAPGSYVFDSTTVTLPAARSMAVIALTDAPARAASPPLLVPAGGGRC